MKKSKKNILGAGIILGTIIGATTTFFMAPKNGIETQKRLINNLNSFFQKTVIKMQNLLLDFELFLSNK